MSPADLSDRLVKFTHLVSEIITDPARSGLSALAAVGAGSPITPRLIVMRHAPPSAPDTPRLALVGKAVTFDTGGYFPQAPARHRPSEGRHGPRRGDDRGPALLDEDRGDAFGRGASGYGVRMLVELASRLSVTLAR